MLLLGLKVLCLKPCCAAMLSKEATCKVSHLHVCFTRQLSLAGTDFRRPTIFRAGPFVALRTALVILFWLSFVV